MKKLIMIVLLGSFVFSGVNFNKGVSYGDLDGAVSVTGTMGVNFDLNDTMSLGWDTGRGMTVDAAGPVGVTIRLGYMGDTSSIGAGYNWWSGGDAIKTTIGTSIDYSTSGAGSDETSISLNLGWGF
jgi:hypothetical protein